MHHNKTAALPPLTFVNRSQGILQNSLSTLRGVVVPSLPDAFYRAHTDRVFRLCLRLCGNCHAEAEDLAQEVLLEAIQSLPRFAGRSQVTTWLYTITVRTYRRRAMQRAAREPLMASLEEQDVSGDRAVAAPHFVGEDSHLLQMHIARAVAHLPPPLREAFVLVKEEGFTHKEAARILSLPQGTVQARVHEAARRLRAALTEEPLP